MPYRVVDLEAFVHQETDRSADDELAEGLNAMEGEGWRLAQVVPQCSLTDAEGKQVGIVGPMLVFEDLPTQPQVRRF